MGVVDVVEWACVLCGVAFKMPEQVEQWISIKFCIKLEHSSMETIWMIQKAAVMGNWWLVVSSWQGACSCIMTHAAFFCEIWNHSGDWALLQFRFGALRLMAFPQTKITFEKEEIQENMTWQLMVIKRTVWGPKVPTLEGTETSLSYVQCFLYLLQ